MNAEMGHHRMEIADRIRRARRWKDWTQADAAALLGCSRRRFNEVEKGRTELTGSELAVLAKALGISVTFFFDGNNSQLLQ